MRILYARSNRIVRLFHSCGSDVLLELGRRFCGSFLLYSQVTCGYDKYRINTGRCASDHGGLLIYLNKMWTYEIRNCVTDSQIWEKQTIEIFYPNTFGRRGILIGNIYRPPYNTRNNYDTFSIEFNAMLQEYHSNSQKTYICRDFNIDC